MTDDQDDIGILRARIEDLERRNADLLRQVQGQALPAVTVGVRPLVWAHKVKGPSGNLEVATQDDGRIEFFTRCGRYVIRDRGTPEAPMYMLRRLGVPVHGSAKLRELYDVAAAHHEAEIRAELIMQTAAPEPQPAPVDPFQPGPVVQTTVRSHSMTTPALADVAAQLNLVEEFVTAVYHLMDNSETSGPIDDPVITLWKPDFDTVSELLDRIEGLPSGSTQSLGEANCFLLISSPPCAG